MEVRNISFEYFYPEGRYLDLSNQNLTDQDIIMSVVPFLNAHPEITILDLSHNEIDTKGAKALASMANLTILSMKDNNIRDEGAMALASMNLKCLDLSLNYIGIDGAKALASMNLDELHVDENFFGDEGDEALSTNNPMVKEYYGRAVGVKKSSPITRANYGREVGIIKVPSLLEQSIFKIQQMRQSSPNLDLGTLPEALKVKIESTRS